MKIYRDIPLTDLRICREMSLAEFEFWPEARERTDYLSSDELNRIEQILEQLYPEGLSEDELNVLFWLEDATIAEWLGHESFAEIMERMERDE